MNKQAIWNFWAEYYERLWVQKYSLAPTREKIVRQLNKLFIAGRPYRIMDVGCGTGQLLREIASEFAEYDLELIGIDFSKKMVNKATNMGGNIRYQHLNVSDINSFGEGFDIIICTHSFPYYERQDDTIRQFKDILKPGGHLLLAQASQNTLYDHVAMFFVKLTTGKANYLSVNNVLSMTDKCFQCENIIQIKEQVFMPSIYCFVLKNI